MSLPPLLSSDSGDIKVARYRRRTNGVGDEPDGEDMSDDDVGVSSDEDEEYRDKSWQLGVPWTIPGDRDFSDMVMKPDADRRPIYVCRDGRVFLETFSPLYRVAYDFLIAISDPLARPHYIHEYKITSYSLYAAASLGLRTDDIVGGLKRLAKNQLHTKLITFIHDHTDKCGKVKLVMKKTRYYVESIYPDILNHLLKNDIVREARCDDKDQQPAQEQQQQQAPPPPLQQQQHDQLAHEHNLEQQQHPQQPATPTNSNDPTQSSSRPGAGAGAGAGAVVGGGTSFYSDRVANQTTAARTYDERAATTKSLGLDLDSVRDPETGFLVSAADASKILLPGTGKHSKPVDPRAAMGMGIGAGMEQDDAKYGLDDELLNTKILSFEILPAKVELVRETCNKINYPMLEEYDFRRDTSTPDLPIQLKPIAQIRDYQEKSLSKMFGAGRARSGIIVLPCGAGKTLVGITAATTVHKSTLVFCTTGVAVDQWRRQFEHWTTLTRKHIAIFTSSVKEKMNPDQALVCITTYNMVAKGGKRSALADEAMRVITSHEWGLVVLDEVHVAPAKMFRKCISVTHSRCKLGLTATLVREDQLIEDLFFLLGPKLYEANWLDLQQAGHIATVQCVEVWCEMTAEFYKEYITQNARKKLLLYVMNPNKFRACEYLIRVHEARGDKILVFSDNVYALRLYAHTLNKPLIYGDTKDDERLSVLRHFQYDPNVNTLFISKVGDNSIDLPDTNVIIQISSHYASRRQEAQRLGRILRPKSTAHGQFNAFFYTLVSKDTSEMYYSSKRQRFLVDQGYSFHVVPPGDLPVNDVPNLKFTNKQEQLQLLDRLIKADDVAGKEEQPDDDPFAGVESAKKKRSEANRKRGAAAVLSGADGRGYAEKDKDRDTTTAAGGGGTGAGVTPKHKKR